MEIIYSELIWKIRLNKAKLEKALKVKISFSKREVMVEGEAVNEYVATQAIEAINLGFSMDKTLLLCNEEIVLEKINIKDLTKRKDLERIRARIIGTNGKTKEIIQNLSDCFLSLHDNTVGIIGRMEDSKRAIQALISIVHGAKQSKVYGYLEKQKKQDRTSFNEDLGLKIEPEGKR